MADTKTEEQPPQRPKFQTRDASIPKLALATIITPKDAFEEICRRKLLGAGIAFAFVTGLVNMIAIIFYFYKSGEGSLFWIGMQNPVTLIGGSVLLAALFQYVVVKFSRGQATFIDTLTIVLWSNVVVLVAIVIGLATSQVPLLQVGPLLGLVIAIMGLKHVHKITGLNATSTYLLAALVTTGIPGFVTNIVAEQLGKAYLQSRYPAKAMALPCMSADLGVRMAMAWIAAAGLVAAAILWQKASKDIEGRGREIIVALAAAGVIGAGLFTYYGVKLDPNQYIAGAVQSYDGDNPDPARASALFASELNYYPGDVYVQLCRAHTVAAAGRYYEAEKLYGKLPKNLFGDMGLATIRYLQDDYKAAAGQFGKIVKAQPRYGEAQARLALVDLRLGKDKEATDAANAAIADKDGLKLAYIVLAEVYTRSGDKKAADQIKGVEDLDPELAKRIAASPGGWGKAVETLTPLDLRMPLELPQITPDETKGKAPEKKK